jgi:leucyl-tRNA synthetase
MAVPAHDQRDFEFARRFGLPIRPVVAAGHGWDPDDVASWADAYAGDGVVINSSGADVTIDGLAVDAAKRVLIDWLTASGQGSGTVTYKLRDWLFSRQRYWGEPFPIVYGEDGRARALPDSMLPLTLPEMVDYRPRAEDPDDDDSEPEPPLARVTDWVNVTLDLGDGPRRYRRETNTMPQWAGSCWYELRYLDPDNDQAFVGADVERTWMGPQYEGDPGGVDLYVGGVEHAVLHLLYSRFWHKVLFDLGHLSSREPFRRLFNQGYIQAFAYTDHRGMYVPADEVVERDGAWWHGTAAVERHYGKMGKSLKNSVSPDDIRARFGADTLRLYEMSMGPLDVSRPWETRAVVGSQRFLQRVWRNVLDEETGEASVVDDEPDAETERLMHVTIDAVRTEMDGLRFNTAIAKLIEFNNHLTGLKAVPATSATSLVLMLAPFAPHAAEELWSRLGHDQTLAYEPFPAADPAKLVADTVSYPVQVDGKVRASITVSAGAGGDDVQAAAVGHPAVAARLDGREIAKVVVVAGRIVSIVTRPAPA